MKYILLILLILACAQTILAQKSPLDSLVKSSKNGPIATHGTKGSSYPAIFDRKADAMKGVYFLPDGSFQIENLDSAETIKLLHKNYEELQEQLQQLRDAFQKAVTFSNTIPLTYKNSKEWKEFLAVMKKLGYKIVKQ